MASSDTVISKGGEGEGAATRERIVAAATVLFVGRGFDAVPVSRVAEAAGVSTPAVYWHFKSKADLYFEVIEGSYVSFFDEVAENTVGETPRERLHSYVRAFVTAQLRETEPGMLFGLSQLVARLPAGMKLDSTPLQQPYDKFLGQILADGLEAGEFTFADRSITALAIHTMCEYSAVWFHESRRLTAGEIAELHGELALRMVAADPVGDDHR